MALVDKLLTAVSQIPSLSTFQVTEPYLRSQLIFHVLFNDLENENSVSYTRGTSSLYIYIYIYIYIIEAFMLLRVDF